MIIICDIDGTLANIDHRLHYILGEKKDWASFSSDENLLKDSVNHWCLDVLEGMLREHNVVFVSGRWERSREVTKRWLESLGYGLGHRELFMRQDGDYRQDAEVKRDILHRCFEKEDILFVIDDRTQVVNMWREEGLVCLQCQGKEY